MRDTWLVDPILGTLEACENSDVEWPLPGVLKEGGRVYLPPSDAHSFD